MNRWGTFRISVFFFVFVRLFLCPSVRGEAFDQAHATWTVLLSRHVHEGHVDYQGLLEDKLSLDRYLLQLASPTQEAFQKWRRDERLAFWINAYNAFTVKAILDHYPVKSIKKIPGVWDRLHFDAAGKRVTLNQIEHKILRKRFQESRIHMAIVCASKGCPPLRNEAYVSSRLDEQLDDNAKHFFRDLRKAEWRAEKQTLMLSLLFSWFREDFGSKRDLLQFVKKYLPPKAGYPIEEKTRIRFLSYDWSLNE